MSEEDVRAEIRRLYDAMNKMRVQQQALYDLLRNLEPYLKKIPTFETILNELRQANLPPNDPNSIKFPRY